jgi:hypothetical protein
MSILRSLFPDIDPVVSILRDAPVIQKNLLRSKNLVTAGTSSTKHLPEIAEGIRVPQQTLRGWLEGKGELTSEQEQEILDFLREEVGRGPEV